MLSTSKPFAVRRIQRSATNKLMFVLALASMTFCIPSAIWVLNTVAAETEIQWIVMLLIFAFALLVQAFVLAILYVLIIGKVLLVLYLQPFYLLLKTICTDDERYILRTQFGIK